MGFTEAGSVVIQGRHDLTAADLAARATGDHPLQLAFKGFELVQTLADIGELFACNNVNCSAILTRLRLQFDEIPDCPHWKAEVTRMAYE